VGDEVLLSTKHVNLQLLKGGTPELYPKYTGPLKVIEVISPVAYKLKLPPTMKCHNVPYISLLKPADFSSNEFLCIENNQAYFSSSVDLYSVDFIVGHNPRTAKRCARAKRFQIRWAGYPVWENTEKLFQKLQRMFLKRWHANVNAH